MTALPELLVHGVIALVLAELLALVWLRRSWLRELLAHLLAGLGLLLALRAVLAGDGALAMSAWLALAGVAHAAAVWRTARAGGPRR